MRPLSETCKQALESWQYRAAKIVIKTRINIPKAALLLELGWEPILDFINRQKVSYYKRLFPIIDYANPYLMKWLEKVTAFGITRNMFLV